MSIFDGLMGMGLGGSSFGAAIAQHEAQQRLSQYHYSDFQMQMRPGAVIEVPESGIASRWMGLDCLKCGAGPGGRHFDSCPTLRPAIATPSRRACRNCGAPARPVCDYCGS